MMKNKKLRKRLIILGVTAVVILGIVIGSVQYARYKNDQKTVEVQPISYLTYGYWGSETSTSGNIVSDYMQELYPDSSKSISEIFVTEGQAVAIGDPLLQYNRESLELDVEAKTVAQKQVQVRIDEANRQLKKLEKTKAYVEPTPTPKPKVTPTPKPTATPTPVPTPTPFPTPDVNVYSELTLDSVPYRGSGTTNDPYVFLCKDGYKLTPDFMKLMLGLMPTPEPSMSPEPEPTPELSPTPGLDPSPEPGPEETPTPEPTETPTPTPVPTESPTPPPWKLNSPFAAVFEVREHDSNYGGLISRVTLDGTGMSGSVSLPGLLSGVSAGTDTAADAVNAPQSYKNAATPTPKPTPEPDNYNHMNYTKKELEELIREKKKEITNLQHDMKQAQLDLDRANRALENSTVLATVEGQVRTLIDIDTATSEGKPFLVVSGAQQYYVNGTISESLLGSVNIGDQVTVNSWMNGMTYSAQIVSISDYPTESNYYSSDMNPNNSYYEFTAVLMDADDTIQNGSYVDIMLSVSDTSSMDALYLQSMYIREDDSGYYVMKAGKDNRLMKSYITVGKSLYNGEALEIKAGAAMEDFIAFPYGPDVKPGVRCVLMDSGEPPFPDGSEDSSGLDGTESLPEGMAPDMDPNAPIGGDEDFIAGGGDDTSAPIDGNGDGGDYDDYGDGTGGDYDPGALETPDMTPPEVDGSEDYVVGSTADLKLYDKKGEVKQ